MMGELKLLALFLLLTFYSGLINARKSELFKMTSNFTLLRKWEDNILSKDVREEKGPISGLDDILHSYLRSPNEDEVIQSRELSKKMEIPNLKDVYINNCETQIILQNVNYNEFDAFQRSPVKVETKIGEISNHRTTQIICSIKTNVMTLSGEMILQNSNYSFTVNLTQPTYRVEKNISHQISFNSRPASEERLENFTYDDFTISIQPKDMYSVVLKKHELRTSILQRLADTWLPVIADSLNNLLLPKIRQYENLLTEDYKTLFVKNICNLLSQQNETKVSETDSSDSITLKGLPNFDHCGGDAMVVKRFDSSGTYNLRHNISILLNYNHSSLLIAKESASVSSSTSPYESSSVRSTTQYYRRNSRNYYHLYGDITEEPTSFRSYTAPSTERSCTEVYVKNIEATIAFEVEKGKTNIKKIIKTDFDISPYGSSLGCYNLSLINEIKSYFSRKLEQYLTNLGQQIRA